MYSGPNLGENYKNYIKRVLTDGGTYSYPDARDFQTDLDKILNFNPSLFILPYAGKTSTLYSTLPNNSSSDFSFSRNSSALYLDSNNILQTVSNNVPRFDFNSNGRFNGLLIEPSSTNLLLRSEEFNDNYWPKLSSSTILSNNIISPNGTLTADRLTIGANGNDILLIRKSFTPNTTIVTGQTYTFSIWIKSDEPVPLRLDINDSPIVDFTTTTEWVRYSVTRVNSTQYQFGDFIDIASTGNNLGKFIYLWGAQLEVGSQPTSYIPTTTTSINRPADSSASQLINYNTSQWSIYFDIEYIHNFITQSADISGSPLVWYFRRLTSSSVNFWNQNAQQNLGSFSFSPANSIKRFKCILLFNGSTISTFVNGTKVGNQITPTNITPYQTLFSSNTNRISLSKTNLGIGFDSQHIIKSLALFDRSLTDNEAITLTRI